MRGEYERVAAAEALAPQLIPRRASPTCFVSVPTWRQAAAPARHAASHASWMPWPLRYACKNPGGRTLVASVKESRREEKEKTTRTICGIVPSRIVPSLTCGEEVSGPGGVHDFDLWRRRAVGLAAVHGHATLRAEADDDHGCEPRQHLQVPFPDEGLGLVLVAEEDVDKGPGCRVVSAFGERRRWRDRDDFFWGCGHSLCVRVALPRGEQGPDLVPLASHELEARQVDRLGGVLTEEEGVRVVSAAAYSADSPFSVVSHLWGRGDENLAHQVRVPKVVPLGVNVVDPNQA